MRPYTAFTSKSDPSSRQCLRQAKATGELAITMHRLPLARRPAPFTSSRLYVFQRIHLGFVPVSTEPYQENPPGDTHRGGLGDDDKSRLGLVG